MARRRARSTAALVRKTVTFLNPAVIPPLAMVKPTDDSSWSIAFVISTTSSRCCSDIAHLCGKKVRRGECTSDP